MNLKSIACSALTLSAFFLCSPLQAGGYLGGGLGFSSFNYGDVDDGDARKIYFGYRLEDSDFAIEIAAIDSGEASVDNSDLELSVDGVNLSASL